MPADAAWIADLDLAMRHGGPEASWRVMALRTAEAADDVAVAHKYCEVARAYPGNASAQTLSAIATAFSEVETQLAVASAFNAMAARRPLDAPPRPEGPEHEALRLCSDALQKSPPDEIAAYLWVNSAHALRAMGPDKDGQAQEAYHKAIALSPEKGAWHLDLANCHKWRGRWQAAFDEVLRAKARPGVVPKAALWNLAICATALGEGDLAAGAWKELGIANVTIAKGGLPLVDGVPPRRVRVRSRAAGYGVTNEPDELQGIPPGEGGFEMLHVTSLSPCHGVVSSPSFEDTPIDYGDIVLWDGAPVAEEQGEPVFPVLELLRKGDEHRLRFVAIVAPGELVKLTEALGEGVKLFVHDANPEVEPDAKERLVYGKLIAPEHLQAEFLRQRIEAFGAKERTLRLAMPELYEQLGDTRRAGQEHQTWRGVERAAIKRGLVRGAV